MEKEILVALLSGSFLLLSNFIMLIWNVREAQLQRKRLELEFQLQRRNMEKQALLTRSLEEDLNRIILWKNQSLSNLQRLRDILREYTQSLNSKSEDHRMWLAELTGMANQIHDSRLTELIKELPGWGKGSALGMDGSLYFRISCVYERICQLNEETLSSSTLISDEKHKHRRHPH